MGDPVVEAQNPLAKPVSVTYRSNDQILAVESLLKYLPSDKSLEVGHSDEPVRIALGDIKDIKARDYKEHDNYTWILSLLLDEEKQVMLEFRQKEERDKWTAALKSAIDATKAAEAVADDGAPRCRIVEVVLQEPEEDMVASVAVKLDRGTKKVITEMIHLPLDQSEPEDIKYITQEFMTSNEVDHKESTSLYRLLRTIAQRSLMERETTMMVDEIQKSHVDQIMKESFEQETYEEVKAKAEARLKELKEQIHQRLGEHGTANNILAMMLKQNIERMLHINELTVKARLVEAEQNV